MGAVWVCIALIITLFGSIPTVFPISFSLVASRIFTGIFNKSQLTIIICSSSVDTAIAVAVIGFSMYSEILSAN